MANHKRFQHGSGCYTCINCKRRTRATDPDSHHLSLCEDCYNLCGLENQISDNGSTPDLLAEQARLRDHIIEKGGVL